MVQPATKRINVTVPVTILEELRHYVPRHERNRFIVTLMEREVHQLRLRQALQESAGAWGEADHPDLQTVDQVNRYVRHIRETALPYQTVEEDDSNAPHA